VILLAGGHVPAENAFFKEIALRELLIGYKGVIMGVSAGSMNAADTVYVQPEEAGEAVDPTFVRWTQGLGLTDKNILPHYNMVKDNILDGLRLFEDVTYPDSVGHPLYVLLDGSYILETEEGSTLYGESFLLHNGVMELVCHEDESITLN
jgi:dipeptidase E